jgi:hypothetical protein
MYEQLLRRLWSTGLRRGRAGSRSWVVIAAAAGGFRLLRHVAQNREEILYRTVVKPGDQFRVTASPPVKK